MVCCLSWFLDHLELHLGGPILSMGIFRIVERSPAFFPIKKSM